MTAEDTYKTISEPSEGIYTEKAKQVYRYRSSCA